MPSILELLLVGVLSGALGGALGAGAGFATVVLFIAVGVNPHIAVGTSLIYTIIVGGWGTIIHVRQRTANLRIAIALGIPSAATALVGAQVADSVSDQVLTVSFAALSGVTAVALMVRGGGQASAPRTSLHVRPVSGAQSMQHGPATEHRPTQFEAGRRLMIGALAGGAAIGLLKGMFGVGGGFLLVPFMVLVLRVPDHTAVGSSLFAILIGSLTAGARHASLGNVDWEILTWLVAGGLVGGYFGARLSPRLSPRTLRAAFVVMLLASTAYLLARSF